MNKKDKLLSLISDKKKIVQRDPSKALEVLQEIREEMKLLKKADLTDKFGFQYYIEFANLFDACRDFKDAIQTYNTAWKFSKSDDQKYDVLYSKGMTCLADNQYRESLRSFGRAYKIANDNYKKLNILGWMSMLYYKISDFKMIIKNGKKFFLTVSENKEEAPQDKLDYVRLHLFIANWKLGNETIALYYYNDLVKDRSTLKDVLASLYKLNGHRLFEMNDYKRAGEEYKKSLKSISSNDVEDRRYLEKLIKESTSFQTKKKEKREGTVLDN